MGGPLGKAKKITESGIEDVTNDMGAFMVVRAESHEAAARLFEQPPHSRSFRATPWRSCGFCRFRALERPRARST